MSNCQLRVGFPPPCPRIPIFSKESSTSIGRPDAESYPLVYSLLATLLSPSFLSFPFVKKPLQVTESLILKTSFVLLFPRCFDVPLVNHLFSPLGKRTGVESTSSF